MRFPNFPNSLFKTDVEVVIYSDETSMTGKPVEILNKKFECNYQSVNIKNSSELERSRGVNAVILIKGNIFKNDNLSCGGYVKAFGIKADIVDVSLVRNPDGTVNYTRITTK